jgi:hypothetical protein
MSNEEKGIIYDNCIRESEILQRENSKIKSHHVGNIPQHLEEIITRNNKRIDELVKILERLF